jgi:hypothetical protein
MLRMAARVLVAALWLLLAAPVTAGAQDPDGLVQSHLRKAVVTLPEGVSVSPGGADGLAACSDEQLKLGTTGPAECPDASKIGAAAAAVPLLEETLHGSVFVRSSTPGQLFRLALTLSAPARGVHIKLPGEVQLDPVTGQVTVTFDQLPRLPFDNLHLEFKGGPRALLANPLDCGTYAVQSLLTPWSGTAPVSQTSLFEVSGSCPRVLPFDPDVVAGTLSPVAGASTPFLFRVRRADGRQELQRVSLELPPGLTAVLRGVPLCPAAEAAAGTCAGESRIGSATVGAGAGSAPLYLSGRVFLTEGYGGGQFGLSVVVPALAGPFDLGTVVVRAAIHVDPRTAQLRVESDPLPRILEGVVLRLRDLHLAIDRPGFIRNPTSCRAMQVNSLVHAVQGASAPGTSPFQVTDCAALRFKPRLSVALTSRGRPRRDKPLGLRARLRPRAGHANVRSVAFTLPPEVAFDALRRRQRLCTRDQLAARACPPATRIGSAHASTPLLDGPMSGPVYFIRGVVGDRFPKLAMPLEGEHGLRIDLLGSTDVTRRGLRTSFGVLPDVPVSDFRLRLRRGLLTPTRNLCRHRPRADLTMAGQNGKRLERSMRVGVRCPSRKRTPRD